MKNLLYSFVFLIQSSYFFSQNIFDATRSGDLTRIEYLMSLNPDTIKKPNENGFTPLVIAAYRNQLKAAEFFLMKGVDINYDSPEGTALIGACYKGNLEMASLLIKYKADVNLQNEQGTTALIFAVQSNNADLVKLLLDAGAKKEMKEKSGKKAIDFAITTNNVAIINELSK